MAWEGSTRKATLPPDWAKIRIAVFERDGWQCTKIRSSDGRRCSEKNPSRLECDHVSDRLDHSMAGLTTLCHWHHLRKSSSQGGTAAAAAPPRVQIKRPERVHPGLIQKR